MRRILLALVIIGALIGISPRAHGQSGIGGGTAPGSGSNGLSGQTAGQVPIAATATTATSSKALAGSGAAITTGPSSSTTGDCVQFTGSAGQISDSGSACGSGAGTVTHSAGALTAKQLVIGNGSADIAVDPDAETDGAGNLTATSVTTPGDGTHPGAVYFVGNTTNPTIPTNDFGIAGFTVTNATAYGWQPNSTAPSGTQFMTAGTPTSGWSPVNYVSSTGSGSVVLAASPTLTGTLTAAIISASGAGTFSAAGAASTPGLTVTGAPFTGSTTTAFPQLYVNSGTGPTTLSTNGTMIGVNSPSGFTGNEIDIHGNGGGSLFSISSAGVITNNSTIVAGSTVKGSKWQSTTNCASGASPAVCTSASSGAVALPTGTGSTLVVDTSAVAAGSEILLSIDDSLTIGGTTCNSTLATLVGTPLAITARTAGTSFTISTGASTVISTNPVCIAYTIVN